MASLVGLHRIFKARRTRITMPSERVRMVEAEIAACRSQLRTMLQAGERGGNRKLIITTGDISDVDGFFALAEYAKTGADVMFVMNYPAYLNCFNETCRSKGSGLGYAYSAKTMLRATRSKRSQHQNFAKYKEILKAYGITDDSVASVDPGVTGQINGAVLSIFSEMAFQMAVNVWSEFKPDFEGVDSRFYFCIGGVNDVNPFHSDSIKDEILVYANGFAFDSRLTHGLQQGTVYTQTGEYVEFSDALRPYDSVYMDMNGSAAFYDALWAQFLHRYPHKIRGVVVMGGVYSYAAPTTIPAIENVLNRFSCSTMNQLYSPIKTWSFFGALDRLKIPTYVVANNAVVDLKARGVDRGIKDAWRFFLGANELAKEKLMSYSQAYYVVSPYGPAWKPFDFYAAKIIRGLVVGNIPTFVTRYLFNDMRYGVTLISTSSKWEETRAMYISHCDTTPNNSDDERTKGKKLSFLDEQRIMNAEMRTGDDPVLCFSVCVVEPVCNIETFVVSV